MKNLSDQIDNGPEIVAVICVDCRKVFEATRFSECHVLQRCTRCIYILEARQGKA